MLRQLKHLLLNFGLKLKKLRDELYVFVYFGSILSIPIPFQIGDILPYSILVVSTESMFDSHIPIPISCPVVRVRVPNRGHPRSILVVSTDSILDSHFPIFPFPSQAQRSSREPALVTMPSL